MNSAFVRILSRVLIASLICLPLQAQAGLIGTGQAAGAAQAQAARSGIDDRLQALGIPARDAKDRIAALTDAEALSIADRIDRLPAGADGGAIGAILVIIFLIWRFNFSDQAKAEAAKPAPEQKK